MLKLFIGKMIFTVLVTEFKLRGFGFTQSFFKAVEFFEVVCKHRALVIVTFVNGAVTTMFPKIKRMVTMGTPEFSFAQKTAMKFKQAIADFAFDLRAFFTVVEIQIF